MYHLRPAQIEPLSQKKQNKYPKNRLIDNLFSENKLENFGDSGVENFSNILFFKSNWMKAISIHLWSIQSPQNARTRATKSFDLGRCDIRVPFRSDSCASANSIIFRIIISYNGSRVKWFGIHEKSGICSDTIFNRIRANFSSKQMLNTFELPIELIRYAQHRNARISN